jgi:hypothetical protein
MDLKKPIVSRQERLKAKQAKAAKTAADNNKTNQKKASTEVIELLDDD